MASFSVLDSTNAQALSRARAGARGPLWITAATQTGGRGRQGRVWVSPPGNLHATCLIAPGCPLREASALSFVAALATADAIAAATGGRAAPALKWPNDILLGGAKAAGLLLESEGGADDPAIAIGIGVNLAHAPADTPYPATSLAAATGLTIAADTFLGHLNGTLAARVAQWRGQGLAAILADWRARAHGMGHAIRVRLPSGDLHGIFSDIGPDGTLALATDGGMRHVTAGDVFFTAPMDRD